MDNQTIREVYEIRFFNPADNTFGVLSIAADSEWEATLAFNMIPGLVHWRQELIKFI